MANTTELERARPVILVTDYGYEDKVKAQPTTKHSTLWESPYLVSFLKRCLNWFSFAIYLCSVINHGSSNYSDGRFPVQ